MAKQTPEGVVKKRLLNLLKAFGDDCFYYMPVQNGMGQTGIPDVMAIIKGIPFAFECKATPKQQPTALQAKALNQIDRALGYAFVVDNANVDWLAKVIQSLVEQGVRTEHKSPSTVSKSELASFLRWRQKLVAMEFDDATCS